MPRIDEVGLNWSVLAFAILVAAATALGCGIAPAAAVLAARRGVGVARRRDGSGAPEGRRFSRVLVGAQTAAAVILLIASGLLVRSFEALLRVDLGYRVDNRAALTMHVWDNYPLPAARAVFADEAEQRIAHLPGVARGRRDVRAAAVARGIGDGSAVHDPGPAAAAAGRRADGALDASSRPDISMRSACVSWQAACSPSATTRRRRRLSSSTRRWRDAPGPGRTRSASASGRVSASPAQRCARSSAWLATYGRPACRIDRSRRTTSPHRQVPFGSMTLIVRTSGDPASRGALDSTCDLVAESGGVLCRHRDADGSAARHAGRPPVHADAALGILARRDRARLNRPLRPRQLLRQRAHQRDRDSPGARRGGRTRSSGS